MPLVEISRIIVRGLLLPPHIEGLVLNDESHLVAQVKKLRSRRIMCCPDTVAAHFLQDLQLTPGSIDIECSSQTTEVVMKADTVDIDLAAVKDESLLSIKIESPYTYLLLILINKLIIFIQVIYDRIKIRGIHIPQDRIRHLQIRPILLFLLSRIYRNRLAQGIRRATDGPSFGILDDKPVPIPFLLIRAVLHLDIQIQLCKRSPVDPVHIH